MHGEHELNPARCCGKSGSQYQWIQILPQQALCKEACGKTELFGSFHYFCRKPKRV